MQLNKKIMGVLRYQIYTILTFVIVFNIQIHYDYEKNITRGGKKNREIEI